MTDYIVTGSHGWIGRRIVQRLRDAGEKPNCVDLASRDHKYDGGIDVVAIGPDWFKAGCVVLHFAVTGGDDQRKEDELMHLRILLNRAGNNPSLFAVKTPEHDADHSAALQAVIDESAQCPVKVLPISEIDEAGVDALFVEIRKAAAARIAARHTNEGKT